MIEKEKFCQIVRAMLDKQAVENELQIIRAKYKIEPYFLETTPAEYDMAFDHLLDYALDGDTHSISTVCDFVYVEGGSTTVDIMEEEVVINTPELLYDWIVPQ